MTKKLKAPFPYFGGKSSVASIIWRSLGDVKHYIEPFFGSGAALLQRPNYDPTRHIETVNDADGNIANVWRAIQFSPDETAKWCDWPVNHADLSARKARIIKAKDYLLENLIHDDKWHDPELAGYWIWAASAWIGSGLDRLGSIPHLTDGGKGVHSIGQVPHLTHGGMGVHSIGMRESPASEKDMRDPYNINIYRWFRQLSERLRQVRVVCGGWTRVCGGNWQDKFGIVGIYFDPPYSHKQGRDNKLYALDVDVTADVMAWCIERGGIKTYRIVLSGYDEYDELKKHGWQYINWEANGGYSGIAGKKNENAKREKLWLSPYCENRQAELFD